MQWFQQQSAGPTPTNPTAAPLADALAVVDAAAARANASYPYAARERVRADVSMAIESFPGLAPCTRPLVGWAHELLALHGTVPIVHQGSVYHIPVCVYLLPSYPHLLPAHRGGRTGAAACGGMAPLLALVEPTPAMVLRPRHPRLAADGSGRCELRTLAEWSAQGASLLAPLAEMAVEFGAVPPCYAAPPGASAVDVAAAVAAATEADEAAVVAGAGASGGVGGIAIGGGGGGGSSGGGGGGGALARPAAPVDLSEELAFGRRAFLRTQLRARALALAPAHAERLRALRAEHAALQTRAMALIRLDDDAAYARAHAEHFALLVSAADSALDQWERAHSRALALASAVFAAEGEGAAGGSSPGLARLAALLHPADARSTARLDARADARAARDALQATAAVHAQGRLSAAGFVKLTRRLARELYYAHTAELARCEK
jgi:hypothetical protein